LINLMESYQKQEQQEILDELFNVILRLISKTPHNNSFLLMKYNRILKDFCNKFAENLDNSNILIFKILYSESKNIQNLNIFSGKPLFLSGVNKLYCSKLLFFYILGKFFKK